MNRAQQTFPLYTGTRRPAPINQLPLGSWYPSDPGGIAYTSAPPEWIAPKTYNKRWFRGAFGGVMCPNPLPYVPGCNTNYNMQMVISFLLPFYKQPYIDQILTAHAQRNLSHFHLDRWNCDSAGLTPSQSLSLINYVQSWGFYTSMWLTGSNDSRSTLSQYQSLTDPLMSLITKSSSTYDKFICLPGEELNNGIPPGSPGLDDILNYECARCNPLDIDIYFHFTSNYRSWYVGDEVTWAQQWANKIQGQCWQSDPTDQTNNLIGTMGAHFWDSRSFWGSVIGPSFTMVAFELTAYNTLFGNSTEEQSATVGDQIQWCPSPQGIGVSGFGDNARYPNGEWI
jgi:hypothetical protein